MKKSRSKAMFTRMKNRLSDMCDSDTSKEEMKETLERVDESMDIAIGNINSLVNYLKEKRMKW